MPQSRITLDKDTAPDERADAPEDNTELVDTERCGRGCHALRVAQYSVPLKGPRDGQITRLPVPGLLLRRHGEHCSNGLGGFACMAANTARMAWRRLSGRSFRPPRGVCGSRVHTPIMRKAPRGTLPALVRFGNIFEG